MCYVDLDMFVGLVFGPRWMFGLTVVVDVEGEPLAEEVQTVEAAIDE